MLNSFSILDCSISTLEKVLSIREQIEALNQSVADIMGGGSGTGTVAKRRGRPPKIASVKPVIAKVDGRKGKRSAATRAKMAAAAKARWAAKNAGATPVIKSPRKKGTMSPEGRARIAAAQRARWAKAKAK